MSQIRAALAVLARIPLKLFVYLAAMLLLPLLVAAVNVGVKLNSNAPGRSPAPLPMTLPAPAYDPARPVAVVLAGTDGAEITDVLPNYDILSRSGVFNVFVVAPQRTVLSLAGGPPAAGGLGVIPDYSFAGYDAAIGRTPDVILVPWQLNYTPARDATVLDWLRSHAGPQTIVVGICSGTTIVADAGLADGHTATTNTGLFSTVQKQYPAVHWVYDARYTDDGRLIMSTNLASGMDATLHLVDRVAGRATAESVAHQIGYPTLRYLDDPHWQATGPYATPIIPLLANSAYRWGTQNLGVELYGGMDELALAAAIEPNANTGDVHIVPVARQYAPVQSLHGLALIPSYDFASAPHLDEVVTPRAADGVWPYEAVLNDIARREGRDVASDTGYMLFLPVGSGLPAGARFPVYPLVAMALLGLLGAALIYGLDHLGRAALRRPGAGLRALGHFGLHFIEMSAAMLLGMAAFGALNALVLLPAGVAVFTDQHPQAELLGMAVSMAAPMAAWMWVRGHGLSHALEMSAAMLVPAVVAIAASAAGILPAGEMMMAGHSLMWVAMLGLMLARWNHYAGAAHGQHTTAQPAPSPA